MFSKLPVLVSFEHAILDKQQSAVKGCLDQDPAVLVPDAVRWGATRTRVQAQELVCWIRLVAIAQLA